MTQRYDARDNALVMDEVGVLLIEKLKEARASQKKWLEVSDYLRDEVNEKIDQLVERYGADEVKRLVNADGTKLATISEVVRKTLDQDALKAAHPELNLDDYQKVSSSRQIRTA